MVIKILHMTFAALVLCGFLFQCIYTLTNYYKTKIPVKKVWMIQHINYTFLVIFGVWMLVHMFIQHIHVPSWIWAKIILFVVAVSAAGKSIKATDAQKAKVGLVVAAMAYAGILFLISTKPALTFLENKPAIQNHAIQTNSK